ncbi:hypothetical protein N7535_009535 [Penicillium sp. DV-2018c]|nr:hypothetical protein N7461_002017 [Penicillium sp. DV-2018c]KAJ5559307.1 hypothetical protein N7535_009535 [Penicillium sp. DV-2018c]
MTVAMYGEVSASEFWKPKPGLWYWKTHESRPPTQFKENKSQQFTGNPSERTRQVNFVMR